MTDIKMYESPAENKWCPGCGNFPILKAIKTALAALSIAPQEALFISGIGQAALTPHFLKCNMFHGLHGRALPLATGAKIANHRLTVFVNSGDGDCFGEGGGHFMHAIRRNVDLTLMAHDNRVYGLTKGQASPTAELGFATRMQPGGPTLRPLNPLALALTLGAGFVARGFAGRTDHLSGIIREAVRHRGLSFIDILQPCVSFNRVNTYDWYEKRVYELDASEKRDDPDRAMALAREWGEKIPIGVLFQKEGETFEDRIPNLKGGPKGDPKSIPLIERAFDPERVRSVIDA